MSDTQSRQFEVSMNPETAGSANLIYVLYLLGLVLGGVPALIGVVIAYMNKPRAPDWLQSHYVFQIHTFWKGLAYFLIAGLLCFIAIGFLLLLVVAAWWIIRCLRGLSAVARQAPIDQPTGWGF